MKHQQNLSEKVYNSHEQSASEGLDNRKQLLGLLV